jgi:hypothetical protein
MDDALPERVVRVNVTDGRVELYFPPLRNLTSAIGLGVFGLIATAIGSIGTMALVGGAAGPAGGVMSAVLLVSFVLPFAIFGIAFVLLALYMALNGLLVHATSDGIETCRTLFGVAFGARRLASLEIRSVESQIATRDQSPFTAQPIFRLLAIDAARDRRLVVGESLEGDAMMQRLKALIEQTVGCAPSAN